MKSRIEIGGNSVDCIRRARSERRCALTEVEARDLLRQYGISTNYDVLAKTEEEAISAAAEIGFPVAMKIVSPDIVHKSDAGGVRLNLLDSGSVKESYRDMMHRFKDGVSGAAVHGVSIQQMVSGVVEMMIGIKRDPVFGSVIVVAAGGTLVELLRDVMVGVSPLAEKDVKKMISSLKVAELLRGYRGRPIADEEAFIQMILKVEKLANAFPEVRELDLNPVILLEEGRGALVVDARANIEV